MDADAMDCLGKLGNFSFYPLTFWNVDVSQIVRRTPCNARPVTNAQFEAFIHSLQSTLCAII